MELLEDRGTSPFQLSSTPYSYQARMELIASVTAGRPRQKARESQKLAAAVLLRRAFWSLQSTAFACLLTIELIPTHLGNALPYLKFVALGFLVVASECAFLQWRRLSKQDNADEKENQTEPISWR